MDKEIIQFLGEGSHSVADLRAKFGKYPKKQMFLLQESGAIVKEMKNRHVYWKLAAGQSLDELTKALDLAVDLIEQAGNDELDKEITGKAIETTAIEISAKTSATIDDLKESQEKTEEELKNEIVEIQETNVEDFDDENDVTESPTPLPSFSGDVKQLADETKKSDTEEQRVPPTSVEQPEVKKGFFSRLFGGK